MLHHSNCSPTHASQTHAKTVVFAHTLEGWVRTSVPVLRDSKATTVRQLGLCTLFRIYYIIQNKKPTSQADCCDVGLFHEMSNDGVVRTSL